MSKSPGAGSEDLCALLVQLAALPEEVEWVEFKTNFKDPEEIGQYLLDAPPQSRNDALAAFMHKAKICEERGSGIDKVFFEVEMFQLPAPDFTVNHDHTISVLLAPRPLAQMGRTDRMRACYQHAGLQFVSYKRMTNASLRERLNIADRNHAIASRIIADTLEVGLIKPFDPENRSKRLAQYIPFWA